MKFWNKLTGLGKVVFATLLLLVGLAICWLVEATITGNEKQLSINQEQS